MKYNLFTYSITKYSITKYSITKYFIVILIILIILILLALFYFIIKAKYENFNNNNDNDNENKNNNNKYNIYCFWTGDNEMSQSRKECLQDLISVSECTVILITKENIKKYILSDNPLHPAFDYLSETHKADYLRTYFMNFYGGGYSDIKKTTGSWKKSFNDLENSDYWMCGYKEIEGGVAYAPYADKWKELIGNCAYICKPLTPLTTEWYSEMINLLDTKLEKLKQFPSKSPQDSSETGSGYPIEWNEMLGRIFQKVAYKYKDKLLNTLPISVFSNYR